MKKVIIMLLIAGTFAACNNKYKNAQAEASVNSIKILKDSLKLDSFKRVESAKKEKMEAQASAAASRPIINNNYSTTSGSTSQPVQKRGWSSAAKGAVIGGAAGALGGALIDKKSGRGAIIGGVAGAGTGYIIGRSRDKKTGRAQ